MTAIRTMIEDPSVRRFLVVSLLSFCLCVPISADSFKRNLSLLRRSNVLYVILSIVDVVVVIVVVLRLV